MAHIRKRSPSPDSAQEHIVRCTAIDDRSSTFVAYFTPTLPLKALQSLPEVADASHKIAAWRRKSNQQSVTGSTRYVTGHEDDGEKYGGKRVEKVLETLKVEGTCVVARWYGGVLLGPVRFKHIEDCATEAITKWRKSASETAAKKKKKEIFDAEDKERLLKLLASRDQNIVVLRALALEKEAGVKQARAASVEHEEAGKTDGGTLEMNTSPTTEQRLALDYSTFSADQLRKLETARDATLRFLLKRIEKAEAELHSLPKGDAGLA